MPTYEYACRQCGHRFEAWQHMSDEPLKVCPKCGAEIHRVLFPAGIVFKGSGFYKTDNGSSSAASSSSKTEKSNAAESKTESGVSKSTSESSKSDSAGSTSPSPAAAAAD